MNLKYSRKSIAYVCLVYSFSNHLQLQCVVRLASLAVNFQGQGLFYPLLSSYIVEPIALWENHDRYFCGFSNQMLFFLHCLSTNCETIHKQTILSTTFGTNRVHPHSRWLAYIDSNSTCFFILHNNNHVSKLIVIGKSTIRGLPSCLCTFYM